MIFIKFFELFFTFWINRIINFRIKSNEFRLNFERIQHLKNLTPPYSWSRIESCEFQINFHRIFRIFFALSNQLNHKFSNRIERILNEFQFDSIPTAFGSINFHDNQSTLISFLDNLHHVWLYKIFHGLYNFLPFQKTLPNKNQMC